MSYSHYNFFDIFIFVLHSFPVIPYRIMIVPNKKGTTTSANVWVVLSGTLSETNRFSVPKSTLNFEFKVNIFESIRQLFLFVHYYILLLA